MGLDIYFHKCKVAEWDAYQKEMEAENAPEFNPEEIGYFRKVNFLMQEFAYYGNCEYRDITREELETLQDKCTRLVACQDAELAKSLLPTSSGFFFGSTDYDEWYFSDVKEVLNWVNGVLDALEDDEVVLMYCWW